MQSSYQMLGNETEDDAPTLRMMRSVRRRERGRDEPTVIIRRVPRRRSSGWAAVGVAIVVVLFAFVGAASAHLALVAFR